MSAAAQSAISDSAVAKSVLGVERSVSGKRWRPRLMDDRLGLAFAQRLALPEIVGRVLAARGVDIDEVESFLNPKLRSYLPDPLILRDMDRAIERIVEALAKGEKLAVFGDYDVDGATSSALLKRFFSAVGADLRIYIPDRLKEGYGPNGPALQRLAEEGVKVAITVDCGISAHAALQTARKAGLDVIVVDHHAASLQLPHAHAIVNPNRLDETSQLGHLAAVGVTFLLVVGLNRRLREKGWFEKRPEPDLRQWLDLVALGTICDVVPLTGLNRAFVTQGLKVLGQRRNRGLAALADVAGVREIPGTFHAGFLLGPRVNAGGRVGEAELGARLLSTEDADEAVRLAARLDTYNHERREIEAGVLEEALSQAETQKLEPASPLIVVGEGWHPGVIGIVASRLVERYARPAVVIALENGVGKGSGRSVPGVDLGASVVAAHQAGLLLNGGGHPMAAGLTVEEGKLAELKLFLSERIERNVGANGYSPSIGIDGSLTLGAVNEALMSDLKSLAPYGSGHAEPRFVFPSVRVARSNVVGNGHVRCFLADEAGGRLGGIAFRAADRALGETLLQTRGSLLHLAGHLRENTWQGRSEIQLVIDDAAVP